MSNLSIILLFAGCGLFTCCLLGRRYFVAAWAALQAHREAQRRIQADRASFYNARDELLAKAGADVSNAFVLRLYSAVTQAEFSFKMRRQRRESKSLTADHVFVLAMKELKRAGEILDADREKQYREMQALCLAGEVMDEFWLVYGRAQKLALSAATSLSAAATTHFEAARVLGNLARSSYDEGNSGAVDSLSREGLLELVAFYKELGVTAPANLSVAA